jgi:hypothetical protein
MRLTCFDCKKLEGKPDETAFFTMHDSRGCKHLCFKHGKVKMTETAIGGHEVACPFHPQMQRGTVLELTCFYCKEFDRKADVAARITIHDLRGCKQVCFKHAQWRMTRSWIGGHGGACPFDRKVVKQ